ncbi:hypothetical protein [Acinetobacter soli]|uniref:hypothetical protein n=1 Tax=Acinetobacter soli TaxID=487316 RepID=UPI001F1AB992|nr:hypothetical protein [Acinetobacter soli]MCE6007563.1 hypothetical protein [Acinetobacter soli]
MKKIAILGLMAFLYGCSNSQVMNAEFTTMDDCISSIQKHSGKNLDIVTDKFGEISGFLEGTKLGFSCKTEATGSKGLLVKGWYEVKD